MTGRAILRLSPTAARVEAGAARLFRIDLMAASERDMLDIRGSRISMIMQDAKYSLNPMLKVGDQIAEAYRCTTRQPTGRRARGRST